MCFDNFPTAAMRSAACRHFLCLPCWQGFISTAISDGPAALDLRCPVPKCGVAVPTALVNEAVNAEDQAKWVVDNVLHLPLFTRCRERVRVAYMNLSCRAH